MYRHTHRNNNLHITDSSVSKKQTYAQSCIIVFSARRARSAGTLSRFPVKVENKRVARDYIHNAAAARAWCVDRTTALSRQQAGRFLETRGFDGPDLPSMYDTSRAVRTFCPQILRKWQAGVPNATKEN